MKWACQLNLAIIFVLWLWKAPSHSNPCIKIQSIQHFRRSSQDTMGGRFDVTQSLMGELSDLQFWSRVLTPNEIYNQATCGGHLVGDVMAWSQESVELHGGLTEVTAVILNLHLMQMCNCHLWTVLTSWNIILIFGFDLYFWAINLLLLFAVSLPSLFPSHSSAKANVTISSAVLCHSHKCTELPAPRLIKHCRRLRLSLHPQTSTAATPTSQK